MMDKFETFMNGLSDMDWGWWPVLFLRPPKEREMDDRLLLKLTFVFGSLVGVLFILVLLFAAVEPLGFLDLLLIVVLCLVFGWILYFVSYRATFVYFWNCRARRLRVQQAGGLRVQIFALRLGTEDWVIDENHPVAVVTVKDGQGSFQFYDKSREKLVREMFTEPASAPRVGGRTSVGVTVDAYVTYPAWTREALELIVNDILRGYSLGGRIIEDGPEVVKPSSPEGDRSGAI